MKNHASLRRLVLAALFLAIAYLLPFLTGQIREVGNMLCPMHLPVLLCGFFCGGWWGMAVGLTAPLLRSLTIGMPKFFPSAVCMAVELAAYGGLSGLFYRIFPKKKRYLYPALLLAMIGGRLVWGLARFLCAGLDLSKFGLSAFWAGAVASAVPGILLQLVLIPVIVMIAEKAGYRDR